MIKHTSRAIYEINNLLKEHEKFHFTNDYNLSAVWKTGKFEMYDYDAGILQISFKVKHPESPYEGFISIITIDDGVWHAEHLDPSFFTKEKCIEISENLHKTYNGVLPTEEELNKFLLQYGIYGTFTG